jgi:glycosyltransferase involved in cell wall biosynthesis
MISVIIPLYNKRKTIETTVLSVLRQTVFDLEIIIVDDESTDDSLKIVNEKFRGNGKIKIFSGLGHYGSNWARNYGAHCSAGEFLFFCDGDIILSSKALEKLHAALLENKTTSYSYCSFRLGWKTMPSFPFDAARLKKINYISTMSLIRRNDFPGFDERIVKFQDWDLWLTMLELGRVGVFVRQVLFFARPARAGISKWMPKFFYKFAWMKDVKKYNEAREIIMKKHGIKG